MEDVIEGGPTGIGTSPAFKTWGVWVGLAALLMGAHVYNKVKNFLQPYMAARRILLAQGLIMNVENTSPFSPDAPWKRQDLHHVGKEDSEKLGGVYLFTILWFNFVQVADPWLMAHVLDVGTKHPDVIDKPRGWPLPVYNCFDRGTSDPPQPSLISAESVDPLWKSIRRGVSPAFNPANIRSGFPTVVKMLDRLLERLGETRGAVIDIDEALQCEAFDVIGAVGFGHDFRATEDLVTGGPGLEACRTIKEACSIGVMDMRNPLQPLLRHIPFLPEKWNPARKGIDCERRIISLMRGLLMDVLNRGTPDPEDMSIAAHMLRVRGPDGKPLPFARLWSELSITFMAGMETTAHTVTWALYLLSQHPEVEAKVLAELDEAGLLATRQRPKPRALEYGDLNKLTYLNAVLKESMRMYSTAPMVMRTVKKDVRLGDYFLPAGTHLCLHVYAMHNISHNWERHDEFLPERFLEPGAEYARPLNHPAPPAHPFPTPQAAAQPHAPSPHSPAASTTVPANPTTSTPRCSGTPPISGRSPAQGLTPRVTPSEACPPEGGETGRSSARPEGQAANIRHNSAEGIRRGGRSEEAWGPEIRNTVEGGGGGGLCQQGDCSVGEGKAAVDEIAGGKGRASSGGGAMRIVASSAAADAAAPRAAGKNSEGIAQGKPDDKVKRFMPFLEGNRQCVGMALARVNYTAALAALLSRFSFRLADEMGGPEGVRASEVYFITVQPVNGLKMHCIPRV